MKHNEAINLLQARINCLSLDNSTLKGASDKISNAVCIDNLIKKNSLFVPSRREPAVPDKSSKQYLQFNKLKYKKQLQPHKVPPADPLFNKSRSGLLADKAPELRQSKHRKNISAVWSIKRASVQKDNETSFGEPLRNYFMNRGQNPVEYEFKMDIKKVETILRQKNTVKGRKLNYTRASLPGSQKETQVLFVSNKELNLKGQFINRVSCQTDNNEAWLANKLKLSQPLRPQAHKQRYIKSTLVSYTTKNKNAPTKLINQQLTEYEHIREILLKNQKITEESIPLVQAAQIQAQASEQFSVTQEKSVSARSFSVCHYRPSAKALSTIFSREAHERAEIASLTKIMTALLILNITRTFKLDIRKQKLMVTERASKMQGTTASLCYSDMATVFQVLHGLLLPSGNDAAVALAEWGGRTIRKYYKIALKHAGIREPESCKSMSFFNEYAGQRKSHQKLFISYMNRAATTLHLRDTRFCNSHGLMNDKAYSTSADIARLTCIAMCNPEFRAIVSRPKFEYSIFNRTYGQTRSGCWYNTNKLLSQEGFVGVKTGVTPSAGPCLSSMYRINQEQYIVVVVLKVRSMQARFRESLSLIKQALDVLGYSREGLILGSGGELGNLGGQSEIDDAEQANLTADGKDPSSDQQQTEQQTKDY